MPRKPVKVIDAPKYTFRSKGQKGTEMSVNLFTEKDGQLKFYRTMNLRKSLPFFRRIK